jgi:hypothetical protein
VVSGFRRNSSIFYTVRYGNGTTSTETSEFVREAAPMLLMNWLQSLLLAGSAVLNASEGH